LAPKRPRRTLAQRETTIDRPAGSVSGSRTATRRKGVDGARGHPRAHDLISIVGELLITRERLQEIGRDLESGRCT
jgi:hypothetical protein